MYKRVSSSISKRFLLAASSLVVTLLVVEVVFRMCGIRGHYHQPRRDEISIRPGGARQPTAYGFVPLSTIRSTYDSNPRSYFELGNYIDHHFNSNGWRDVEHETRKPSETFRILGLGDSYLFGQGVRLEDVCLTRLGPLLAEQLQPLKVETISCGVHAINTRFQHGQLISKGLEYDPDLVILHFVLNDVEESADLVRAGAKVEFAAEYVSIYESADALSRVSNLWGWARQRWLRNINARSYLTDCLNSFEEDSSKWHNCRSAIDDIADVCDERSIGFLVVVFPFFHELSGDYPFQPIHDTVRSHCESNGIAVLDLREEYRRLNYKGPELWVHPTDQHPNEIAHKIAGDAIARYLIDNRQFLEIE